jgi:hypothetical protein
LQQPNVALGVMEKRENPKKTLLKTIDIQPAPFFVAETW